MIIDLSIADWELVIRALADYGCGYRDEGWDAAEIDAVEAQIERQLVVAEMRSRTETTNT